MDREILGIDHGNENSEYGIFVYSDAKQGENQ